MLTARLVVRPTRLDELTAGADDRRYQTGRHSSSRYAVLALVYLHAQSKLDAVGDDQPVEGLTAKLGQTPVVLPTV